MSATIAAPQKQLLRRLLQSGRYNNASEIIRHVLELVRLEIERENLSPLPDDQLAAAYAQMSPDEIAEDRAFGKASLAAQRK